MTIDVAMLRELHYQYDPGFESTPIYCFSCMDNVMDLADAEWPCPTSELLDAYEERDRLRAALLHIEGAISLSRPSLFNQSLSVIARAALEGRE